MKSGQQQIVSVIIVVGLVLAAVATVLPWATSVIQKKKDTKSLDDVYNFFQTLDETIRDIAKIGGEGSLKLNVPGRMTITPESFSSVSNNSITFNFRSKVSNVAEGGWIPLNTPNANETATLGIDPPGVIFGKAEKTGNEIDVWYKLWYRKLKDPSSNQTYKIAINTTYNDEKSTTTGFLRIQRLGSETIGGNLIITKIKIIV